jgi:hypothetical protein
MTCGFSGAGGCCLRCGAARYRTRCRHRPVAHGDLRVGEHADQLLTNLLQRVARKDAAVDDGLRTLGQRVFGQARVEPRRHAGGVHHRIPLGIFRQAGDRRLVGFVP